MGIPIQVERYGKIVWEDPEFEAMRRGNCLCHRCDKLVLGYSIDNCPIAQAFYEICKEHGTAFILTRCDSWTPKKCQIINEEWCETHKCGAMKIYGATDDLQCGRRECPHCEGV